LLSNFFYFTIKILCVMMTKTQFFCFTALLFVICSLFPTGLNAQTCTLEQKYWAYRKNFNEKFVNVDFDSVKDGYHPNDGIGVPRKNPDGSLMMPFRFTKSGTSMPASHYDAFSNSAIPGGNGTIMLGNYMAMLATEYKLLQNGGDAAAAEHSLDELFLALQAYQRMDKEFNFFMLEEGKKQRLDTIKTMVYNVRIDPFTGEPITNPQPGDIDTTILSAAAINCDSVKMNKGIDTSGFSGMFYRTDIAKDDLIGTTTSRNAQNYNSTFVELQNGYAADGNKFVPIGTSYWHGDHQGNFTSFDQITGLLYGLTMINKMIGVPKTDKEKEIVKNANAAIKGLICSGLKRIKLKGCFEGKGNLKGNGTLSGLKEKLLDIARENGILKEVRECSGFVTEASFFCGMHNPIDYAKRICNNWALAPFEANHWARLYAISPIDNQYFVSDIIAYSAHAAKLKKHSFALSAAIFNADVLPENKTNILLNQHCGEMMKKLESAPCCGPCVNCSDMVIKDGINIVHNTRPDWYSEDSNAETAPCGEKPVASFPADRPTFFNGIDYMLSMNLMLLACEQDINTGKFTFASANEDKQPKSTKPADLKAIEGCSDEGELHINGPTEVCAGSTVEFTLSCNEWFSPPRNDDDDKTKPNNNAAWGINGTETQVGGDIDKRNKTTYNIPTNATGTFTVAYNWGDKKNDPRNKQVQKTIKVIDKMPDEPKIVSVDNDFKNCECTIVTEDGVVHTYPMRHNSQLIGISRENACGKASVQYTVPAGECKQIPKVVQNNTNNINVEILSNNQVNTITVKSEVLYNVPFLTQLIDINGRLVKKQEFPNSEIIFDLAPLELQSGMYIFNLSSQDGFSKSQKIYYEHY
jgi:hypothetical protein